MARPQIKSPCVADHYADKRRERIAEFSGSNGQGGLISIREDESGKIYLHIYRLDNAVSVTVENR